ncbi:AraC family transcriptional regulator [Agrococcus sp. SGAir0287]|uniref:AraC family transcriptional regulator n=1 Tax=Agrococcus sp. SGAir0287 TaxID=2070347 RepID=UPI0010CCD7B1|nr:AraC family transcriptional regulator [Agrococcus sp. SGAir0287]QCR18427.1 AraC family transcriptional regulator [Agrococcus sp. SGAir0287]
MDPAVSASLERMAERHRRHVEAPHRAERIGLLLARTTEPTPMLFVRYPPCLSIVLAGRKRSATDGEGATEEWGGERFLITPVDLPMIAGVVELGAEGDFLSMNWRLDPSVVIEVAASMSRRTTIDADDAPRLGTMTPALADALDRLVALLDAPEDAPVLAPLVTREIVLRLLQTDQAPRLLAAAEQTHADLVADAITRLGADLAHPWSLDAIAAAAGTSAATLARRFRAITGLSPMRYLKRLRLGEARRRMLVHGETAAQAGNAVGYVSASHFSRDYRAAYGVPPAADARAWAQANEEPAAV